jgi:hypothetical protein
MQSPPQLRSEKSEGSSLRDYVDTRRSALAATQAWALKLVTVVPINSEFMPRERAVCAIKHVGRKKQVVAHDGRPLVARDARLIPDRSDDTRRPNDRRHYHTASTWFDHSQLFLSTDTVAVKPAD